jgi:hypothetical protein
MTDTPTWNARRVTTEVVVLGIAIAAAYGTVELLRYAFDLPIASGPILATIVLAVLMTRVARSAWLQRLLTRR